MFFYSKNNRKVDLNVQFLNEALMKFEKTTEQVLLFSNLFKTAFIETGITYKKSSMQWQVSSSLYTLYLFHIKILIPPFGGHWMEQNIFVFLERFMYPNSEKLGIFDISTCRCTYNLI